MDENVTDVIEESIEVVKLKNDPLILAGVALIGLSVGALVGYRLAKKYLEPKYAALADEEIAQAKILYSHLNKEGFESPTVAVEKLIPEGEGFEEAQRALQKYQGRDVHLTVVEDGVLVSSRKDQTENLVESEPEQKNIFDEDEPAEVKYPGWDFETELARRSDKRPYVVTQEEYFENADDLDCISVTYYEGDQVLADESDGIIGDIDGNVGLDNLKRFGVGTDEEHLVYIFNKRAGMGFEVARSQGKYSVEVIGMDDDEITERMPRRGRRLGD
jgi:hypothetical protein